MARAPKKTANPGESTAPRAGTRARTSRSKPPVAPTEDQIRMRAFEIFLRRNGGPGDAGSDWLQAERELADELNR